MRVLITNDDGIDSPALTELKKAVEKAKWEAVIVAPKTEQSGVGHSITIYNNIVIEEICHDKESFGYALHGTPADCVKFAVNEIFSEYPDAVISGINRGFNVGTNVLYSGTVSASIEASLLNIPALAVSTGPDLSQINLADFSELSVKILRWRMAQNIPARFVLNVNIPVMDIEKMKGIQFTRQGKLFYRDNFQLLEKNALKTVFVNSGTDINDPEDHLETDSFALKSGYISITPLHFDLTAYEFLKNLPENKPEFRNKG